ncbi:MAG: DNA alkylation repair protein [Rikenellaceae bacterium]
MSYNTLRLAYLLGEMRRQMNGAVVGSMRFYGEEYGLNYGVTLPSIRSIAKAELAERGINHRFAKLLYRQEVRELRLAGLWLADSTLTDEELDFWAAGIINSDVAEEAAFALLHKCRGVEAWLSSDSELLQYSALMAIAKRGEFEISNYRSRIVEILSKEVHILQNGVVALLDGALKAGVESSTLESILAELPNNKASEFIRSEMQWRIEYR